MYVADDFWRTDRRPSSTIYSGITIYQHFKRDQRSLHSYLLQSHIKFISHIMLIIIILVAIGAGVGLTIHGGFSSNQGLVAIVTEVEYTGPAFIIGNITAGWV